MTASEDLASEILDAALLTPSSTSAGNSPAGFSLTADTLCIVCVEGSAGCVAASDEISFWNADAKSSSTSMALIVDVVDGDLSTMVAFDLAAESLETIEVLLFKFTPELLTEGQLLATAVSTLLLAVLSVALLFTEVLLFIGQVLFTEALDCIEALLFTDALLFIGALLLTETLLFGEALHFSEGLLLREALLFTEAVVFTEALLFREALLFTEALLLIDVPLGDFLTDCLEASFVTDA